MWCEGEQRDGFWRYFAPDVWLMLLARGINPCDVPATGRDGLVTRQDFQQYIGA